MDEQIKELVADVLDLDEDEITAELSPDDTEYWDSMNHLRLVTALEEEFDIKLTMDEVQSIENVGDIYAVVKSHKG